MICIKEKLWCLIVHKFTGETYFTPGWIRGLNHGIRMQVLEPLGRALLRVSFIFRRHEVANDYCQLHQHSAPQRKEGFPSPRKNLICFMWVMAIDEPVAMARER